MNTFASKSAILCDKDTYLGARQNSQKLYFCTQATIIYHKFFLNKSNIVSLLRQQFQRRKQDEDTYYSILHWNNICCLFSSTMFRGYIIFSRRYVHIPTFATCFLIPIIFSNLSYNCSNLSDNSLFERIVLVIPKFCKVSAFSLEFQTFFSITRTMFSNRRSEQFWTSDFR